MNLTRDLVADAILRIIKADIDAKLRETDGPNRSPRIDEFERRVHVPLGTPYCAAGAWCAIDDACKNLSDLLGRKIVNPMRPTAASQDFATIPPRHYCSDSAEGPLRGLKGDGCVYQHRDDPSRGHFMMLSADETPEGVFATYEYNTDPEGSREGDGAYAKDSRTIHGTPSLRFRCFVDIPQWIVDTNGGQ